MTPMEIATLPFEIQLVLAAGYLGYRLATAGLDRTHRPVDTIFQVFVYGLVAYLAYALAKPYWSLAFAMMAAVPGALAAAVLWRAVGRNVLVRALRAAHVTRENYAPSTWDSIIHARHDWTYVSVVREDDVIQESNLAELPDGLPLDNIDLDGDGNVALYVTRVFAPDGSVTEHEPLDEHGRAHLTFIPARYIQTVTVSFATDLFPSRARSEVAEGEPSS